MSPAQSASSGGALRTAGPMGGVVAGLAVALGLALMAYCAVVAMVSRRGGLGAPLTVGSRASADRRSVFLRRVMGVGQMSAAGTALAAAVALLLAVGVPEGVPGAGNVTVVPVDAPGADPDWSGVLAGIEAIPGLDSGTLATPAAVVGLGVRDPATAQCGECFRGLMYTPFLSEMADHHAVAPGYFDTLDIGVVAGRVFTRADDAEAEPVAVVNATFARASFQDGDPLGRQVRVGSAMDRWYTAAGVSVGSSRSLSAHLASFAAPLRWTGALAAVLAAVTLLLALQGARATTLQVVRRRIPELAVRRALGASGRRIVRFVVGGSLGVAAWGTAGTLFFGTFLVAILRKAGGGIPMLGPLPYLAIAGVLAVSMLLASWKAAREAVAVEPGVVLESAS